MSWSTSRRSSVAKHATSEDEAKYGLTLLEPAIGFVEAEHGPLVGSVPVHERARLLSFAGVPISAREIFGKTVAQANVAEIAGSAKTAHQRAGNGTVRRSGGKN